MPNYSEIVTKEELDELIKEVVPQFKHIEPHIIILLYVYIKKREMRSQ